MAVLGSRRPAVAQRAALLWALVLVLAHLCSEGRTSHHPGLSPEASAAPPSHFCRAPSVAAVVRVVGQPGHRATLPCFYPFEDRSALSQLSVQWRDPAHQLLCHYIKHKDFQRCSAGYQLSYRPGSITLTIQRVRLHDFGPHVCSVSRRDQFLDYSVELVRAAGESDR